jgi:hypothetical protein
VLRPYGLYVNGGMDTTDTMRASQAITTGLRWREVRLPVCVTGTPAEQDLLACRELGAACGRDRRVIGSSCHGRR